MNDILKWLIKTLGLAVVWVFILSIEVRGRTLFSHANEILVQNDLVRTLDAELSEAFYKAKEAITESFDSKKDDRQRF